MAKQPSKDLRVALLDEQHDRSSFTCGVENLDRYLKIQAGQDIRQKANAVFVLTEVGEPARILGYYTLCAMAVSQGDVPETARKHIPRYPLVSATLIGRLAVAPGTAPGRASSRRCIAAGVRERRHGWILDGGRRCARRAGGRFLCGAWVRAITRLAAACAADASCRRDAIRDRLAETMRSHYERLDQIADDVVRLGYEGAAELLRCCPATLRPTPARSVSARAPVWFKTSRPPC